MAPARVLAVEPDFCVVEAEGRRRRASTLLADTDSLHVGDWVLVAGGAVVRQLEPEQAVEIMDALGTATIARRKPEIEP